MEISVHPAVPVQQGDDRAQRDALIQEVRAAIERDLRSPHEETASVEAMSS
jgi:hypothetical protein